MFRREIPNGQITELLPLNDALLLRGKAVKTLVDVDPSLTFVQSMLEERRVGSIEVNVRVTVPVFSVD